MIMLQALYGGTFDPVHYGHLKPVEILENLIGLKRVIIMPNKLQPHRPRPKASNEHRKAMLELAIADKPLFNINELELCQNEPSYTSQTLQKWRAECGPKQPLAFIIGQDSLLNFFSWYEYESILDNSHLIVCRRRGYPLKMKKENYFQWLKKHLTKNTYDLYNRPSGNIYIANTPCFDISATIIRYRLKCGKSCDKLIPPSVLNYITKHSIYQ